MQCLCKILKGQTKSIMVFLKVTFCFRMPCSGGLDNNEIIVLLVFQSKQKGSNCVVSGLDLHNLRHYIGHRLV